MKVPILPDYHQVNNQEDAIITIFLTVVLFAMILAVIFLVVKEIRSSIALYNKTCTICKIETV